MVRYGDGLAREVDSSGIHVVSAPVALLRDLHIVDTPGTNAINRAHERLTVDFVPRADLVLFVTSADRPFTETERLFLESIRNLGKKIVLVVNKIDIFENERDLAEVVQFVSESSMRLLDIVPEVFFGQRAAAVLPAPRERPAGLTAFQWLIYLTYCRRREILAPDSLPNW